MSNVQFREAESVVSSIKERIEPVWVTLLERRGCLSGVEILCGLPKRPGGAIGWGRTFEGTVCANEENKPKDTRVGSISTGKDDVSR